MASQPRPRATRGSCGSELGPAGYWCAGGGPARARSRNVTPQRSSASATVAAAAHDVSLMLRAAARAGIGGHEMYVTCGQGGRSTVAACIPPIVQDICDRHRSSLPAPAWARACWAFVAFVRCAGPPGRCMLGCGKQGDCEPCPCCYVLTAVLAELHACLTSTQQVQPPSPRPLLPPPSPDLWYI